MAREAACVTRTMDPEADRGRMGVVPNRNRLGRGLRREVPHPSWKAGTTKAGVSPGEPIDGSEDDGSAPLAQRRPGIIPGEVSEDETVDRMIVGPYRHSRPRSSATAVARRRSWSIAGRTKSV